MIWAILGFAGVAASGVAFYLRGRGLGAVVLGAMFVPTFAVAALSSGRSGISDLTVGALSGLPVLIAGALAHERSSRRHA